MPNIKYEIDIRMPGSENRSDKAVDSQPSKSIVENTSNTIINAGLLVSTAKSLLNIGTSSVEMLTGSTMAQANVNSAMTAVGIAAGMLTHPIATTVALAMRTVSFNIARNNETTWQNREAERMRRLSGNFLSGTER